MQENLVTKFKWFWGWQDDKQEAWLEAMSRRGLHLKRIRAFGRYVFELGEPKNFIYRLDFDQKSGQDSEYFNLIEEAGWVRIAQVLGWQYWRKETAEGKSAEIFTDNESKIRKYRRLLASWMVPSPAIMVIVLGMFKRFPGRHPQWVIVLTISIFAVWSVFLVVNFLKVTQRINNLKRMRTL